MVLPVACYHSSNWRVAIRGLLGLTVNAVCVVVPQLLLPGGVVGKLRTGGVHGQCHTRGSGVRPKGFTPTHLQDFLEGLRRCHPEPSCQGGKSVYEG